MGKIPTASSHTSHYFSLCIVSSLKPIAKCEAIETNRGNCKPYSCTYYPGCEGHSTAEVPGSWRHTCLAEVPCTGPYGCPGIIHVCNNLALLNYSYLQKAVGRKFITCGKNDALGDKSHSGLRLFTIESKMQDDISCIPGISTLSL